MKKILFLLCGTAVLFFFSCKKEKEEGGFKAVFSYITDGFVVNFTNFSREASVYEWDFGDGSEGSTLKNPSHIFTQKGDFLVSLTAKNEGLTDVFVDTVFISGPSIKIDGDFTDWTYVEYAFMNEEDVESTLRAIKAFSSLDKLNILIEGTSDMEFAVLDIYLNSDNDPETGYNTWLYPVECGADYLLEGNFSSGSVFQHSSPDQDAWSWDEVFSFGDVLQFSPIVDDGDKKIMEFSIDLSKLGKVKDAVGIAIIENDAGWSPIGSIPASGMADSELLKVDL